MITYTRNGPEHDDFTPPKYWYVEPNGPIQFTQPVILLTHRFSVSAAENFALAMRVLPHVTVVGDATSGVFADVYGDRLPNGWQFRCSYKLFVDHTGFCWEGIGVPADIRQINTKEDIQQERDRVLELAMDLINADNLRPQDESGSLQNIRESLAKTLSINIASMGIEAAREMFDQVRAGDPNSYYIDEEEMNALGERLSEAGQQKEALDVFKLNAEIFSQSWRAHETLGEAYMTNGEETQARECYRKSVAVNRQSYPWEIQSFANADRITKGIELLANVLARTIDEKGIAAAIEAFHRVKRGGAGTYYIDEGEINALGYRLIRSERIEEAIEVFKINVEEFPESWNVYDSLGEAYMVQGKNDLAIEYYEKSIALNPNNQNGIDILKRLKGQ
jgi:tetratricopeptide (TPR) repeat protein